VRAAIQPDLSDSGTESVCGDTDDDRLGQRAVRSAVEHRGMRILPERSDDDMSGLPDGDWCAVAATGQDRVNSSDDSV
jgi:hypothetical protein